MTDYSSAPLLTASNSDEEGLSGGYVTDDSEANSWTFDTTEIARAASWTFEQAASGVGKAYDYYQGVRSVGTDLGNGIVQLFSTNPLTTLRSIGNSVVNTVDSALVAENTPATIQLGRAGSRIYNASAYDLGRWSGNAVLAIAPELAAGRVTTVGRMGAAERGGADLIASRPKILSDASLPSDELAYLQKQFSRKELSIQRAANRGELTFSPGTDSVRIKSLQEAYRADVAARYESMYGKPLDLSRFNADHPVDLIVGGAADQRLRLLNDTINQSVGSSLRQAAKRANLTPGAPINSVTFR